ncbi:MAG: Gfo/Idh/MocA family oxidoreductase, partial [Actinobacteria bacterium]|nr:Gfo/Idh/MocA family oxidoreductase [Actinomycetota bacterium]
FVRGMHLPNLSRLREIYRIFAVCDKAGDSALGLAEQYGAEYGTTDYSRVLEDKDVDMVLIATRHNLHAEMAAAALEARKAVFIEKPLAMNEDGLIKLIELFEKSGAPLLMVDFNRRFSSYSVRIKEIIEKRINPMMINYRMNAGYIPEDSWVHSEEGGGRNIGEACHIYDLFNYFTDSEVFSVMAGGISPKTGNVFANDNFSATIKYKDGSICNLIYTALGSDEVPKEQMEIYFDNKMIFLDDYTGVRIYGSKEKGMAPGRQDKGHMPALKEFGEGLKKGAIPIPAWQMVQATAISFEVEKQISGKQQV